MLSQYIGIDPDIKILGEMVFNTTFNNISVILDFKY
jgi:hypothetical protein